MSNYLKLFERTHQILNYSYQNFKELEENQCNNDRVIVRMLLTIIWAISIRDLLQGVLFTITTFTT